MYKLIDKLILLTLCTSLYVTFHLTSFHIIFILLAIIVSSAGAYYEKTKFNDIFLLIYLLLCLWFTDAIFFIPLIIYDFIIHKYKYFTLIFILPILTQYQALSFIYVVTILLLILIAIYLQYRSTRYYEILYTNMQLKEEREEYTLLQELRQKELLEKQDYEIELAKSGERNRIAREIHDSVGHNLSSSLLQIGAMIAINKDEKLNKPLVDMKETLQNGMNSIRNSVHDLHEDTFHLKEEMQNLVDQFHFCDIDLQYNSSNLMDLRLKYCFINILKEALNNITKHSNATRVTITFIENPQFYQFCIWDNGSQIHLKDGLGLKSMEERVHSFNGICTITKEQGFKIFINIPKEDNK